MPVPLNGQQLVPRHPGDRLAHRRPRLLQPFGDAGAQRNDALLLELEDGAEVHLRGVNQIAHGLIIPACVRFGHPPRSAAPLRRAAGRGPTR